jgi:Undecaprenyl-phosphate galactose phosphotransferase WbaP
MPLRFDRFRWASAVGSAAVARLIDEELQVPYGITVGLRNISNGRFELQKSFGHDLILIHNYPIKWIGYKKTIKRLFDILGASVILFCLSVPLLVIALLVRLDGGPVFYSSARIGRAGRLFYALKFRSMVPDADKILSDMLVSDHALKQEWETNFKLKSDPRITRIGRILRSTSLDEVPQLLNVLRGEMSLVGPRPILPDERNQYTGHAFNLYSRVTPGLTGVWQVSGRDHLNYNSRIELNNWYIANWSLWVDLVILCRTLIVVVRRVGAS